MTRRHPLVLLLLICYQAIVIVSAQSTNAAINQLLATLSNRSPGVAIDFSLTKKCDTYKFSGLIPDADVTFIPADLPCGASFGLPTMPSLVNNFASVSCMNDGSAIVSACPAVGNETKISSSAITLTEALICNSPLGSGFQFASFGIYRSQCRGMYILDNSSTANCSLPSSKKPKNPTFLRARDKSQVNRCPPGVNVGSLPWAMTCTYFGVPTVHFCNGNSVRLTPSDKCDIAPRDPYLNIGGFSYNSNCGPPVSTVADSFPIVFTFSATNFDSTSPLVIDSSQSSSFSIGDSTAFVNQLPASLDPSFVGRVYASTFSQSVGVNPVVLYTQLYILQNQTAVEPVAEVLWGRLLNISMGNQSSWVKKMQTLKVLKPGASGMFPDNIFAAVPQRSNLCIGSWKPPQDFEFQPDPQLCPPSGRSGKNPLKAYSTLMQGLFLDIDRTLSSCPASSVAAFQLLANASSAVAQFIPTTYTCGGEELPPLDFQPTASKVTGPSNFLGNVTCNLDGSVTYRACNAAPNTPLITLPAAPICGYSPAVGVYRTQCQGTFLQNMDTDRCWNIASAITGSSQGTLSLKFLPFVAAGSDACMINPSGMQVSCQSDGSASISPCPGNRSPASIAIPATPIDECFPTFINNRLATVATQCGVSPAPHYVSAVSVTLTTSLRTPYGGDSSLWAMLLSTFPSNYAGLISITAFNPLSVNTTELTFQMYGTSVANPSLMLVVNSFFDAAKETSSSLNTVLVQYQASTGLQILSSNRLFLSASPNTYSLGFVCNFTKPAFQFVSDYSLCPSPPNQPVVASVQTSLRLNTDVLTASTPTFQSAFIQIVATSLQTTIGRISIVSIVAGSVVITVELSAAPPNTPSPASPLALAAQLQAMSSDPSSALVQSISINLGVAVDSSYVPGAPSTMYTCPDGTVRAVCPPATPPSSSNSLVIAVGVSVAVIIGVAAFVWYRRQQTSKSPLDQYHHDEISAQDAYVSLEPMRY